MNTTIVPAQFDKFNCIIGIWSLKKCSMKIYFCIPPREISDVPKLFNCSQLVKCCLLCNESKKLKFHIQHKLILMNLDNSIIWIQQLHHSLHQKDIFSVKSNGQIQIIGTNYFRNNKLSRSEQLHSTLFLIAVRCQIQAE